MPNFEITVSGAEVASWIDSVSPSRLNPQSGSTLLRYLAYIGDTVTLTATVDGVEAPMDSALGDELFVPFAWEYPSRYPNFSNPTGQSSVQSFTASHAGHYLIGIRRVKGGTEFIHVSVEVPP